MSKEAAEQAKKAFDEELDGAIATILNRWRVMKKEGLLEPVKSEPSLKALKQYLQQQGQSSE